MYEHAQKSRMHVKVKLLFIRISICTAQMHIREHVQLQWWLSKCDHAFAMVIVQMYHKKHDGWKLKLINKGNGYSSPPEKQKKYVYLIDHLQETFIKSNR